MVCRHSSCEGDFVIDISESIEACANHYGVAVHAKEMSKFSGFYTRDPLTFIIFVSYMTI